METDIYSDTASDTACNFRRTTIKQAMTEKY